MSQPAPGVPCPHVLWHLCTSTGIQVWVSVPELILALTTAPSSSFSSCTGHYECLFVSTNYKGSSRWLVQEAMSGQLNPSPAQCLLPWHHPAPGTSLDLRKLSLPAVALSFSSSEACASHEECMIVTKTGNEPVKWQD